MQSRVGQQVGNYRLVRMIGEGGFAEVYLGEHVYLKTQAAIKILRARLGPPEQQAFLEEAQTIARLRHPNIVRVLDFGVEGGAPFLVMDYAPGGTLAGRFPKGVAHPLAAILPAARQVAEALQYAHDEKLIHRDIKPENMLLGPRDEVLLSDFGIAVVAQSSRYQGTQEVAGTVAYMAPEQLQGRPRPASDQYSLAVVIYEWLTGERPFEGLFTEIVSQHALKAPPALHEKQPTISPAVEQVVLLALAKDPKTRFGSVRAFARALAAAGQLGPGELLPPARLSALTQPTEWAPTAGDGGATSQPAQRGSAGDSPPGASSEGSFFAQDSLRPGPRRRTLWPQALRRGFNRQPASSGARGDGPRPTPVLLPKNILTMETQPGRIRGREDFTALRTRPFAPAPPLRKRPGLLAALLLGVVLVLGGLGTAGYAFFHRATPTANAPYPYRVPTHKGGTLTYATVGGLDAATPWFLRYTSDIGVLDALWGGPLVITPDGHIYPDELSETPTQANGDVSKDGLTVTLKLRQDLRWSDGQPLTSEDFTYWLQVLLDPQTGAVSTAGYDQIASTSAPDPFTLVLKYKQVFAPYLSYLPLAAPQHAWGSISDTDLAARPAVRVYPRVTSGPFLLGDISSGDSDSPPALTLTPNPYYVSTTLHPTVLDRLIYKTYPDTAAELADYQQGRVDVVEDLTADDLPTLSGLAGLSVAPRIGYEHLDFNLTRPVLQDVSVRKAIEEAIDRCQIIQTVLGQRTCASLRADTILPKPSPDYDPTNTTYPFNLSAALADMQTAGWDCSSAGCTRSGQPFPALNLAIFSGAPSEQIAALISQDLAALGITVYVHTYGLELMNDLAHGGILATGQFDLTLFDYLFGLDSDGNLYPYFHSSQIPSAHKPDGQNYAHVNDLGVDQLLDEGRMALDTGKRSAIYKAIQRILVEKVYVVPLFLEPNITLSDTRVGNFLVNPTVEGNEWNIGDWFVS